MISYIRINKSELRSVVKDISILFWVRLAQSAEPGTGFLSLWVV